MPSLIEFPKHASGLTYKEAMEAMIEATEEEVNEKPVTNLIVIGFKGDDYQFGMLNENELRGLLRHLRLR